jgi:hypothetical protein
MSADHAREFLEEIAAKTGVGEKGWLALEEVWRSALAETVADGWVVVPPVGAGDWTAHDGRSNSSPLFLELCDEVGRLIRGEAFSLIRGDTRGVGGLIMAQLAHKHGMVPVSATTEAARQGLEHPPPQERAETAPPRHRVHRPETDPGPVPEALVRRPEPSRLAATDKGEPMPERASLRAMLHSHQRVSALAELCHRYAAVTMGLAEALAEASEGLEGEDRARADRAIATAEAQVRAMADALGRAFMDLPEGDSDEA